MLILISFLFLLIPTSIFANYDENSAKQYWQLTTASYCTPNNLAKWKVNKEVLDLFPNITDIRVYENKWTSNLGYLAYNPSTNTIILTFRGTKKGAIMNYLQDLGLIWTSLPNCSSCSIHRGFYSAYQNLPTQIIISDLKALINKYPSAKTVISGHSLGAAMANFAYLDACKSLGKIDLLITYGCPRIGNPSYASFFRENVCGETVRVVHNKDPVPHFPWNILGFEHAQSEIFYTNHEGGGFVFCRDSEDEKCSKNIVASLVSDHLAYMDFAINCDNC